MGPALRASFVFWAAPLFAGVVLFSACAEGDKLDDPLYTNGAGTDAGKDGTGASLPNVDAGVDPDPVPAGDAGKQDSGGSNVNAACAAALAAASYDFEGADQGWTTAISDGAEGSATWPFNPWSRGVASNPACPDGQCFGAERLQNYAQCQRGELISPKIDLKACAGQKVFLTFQHSYDFWTGSYNNTTWFDGGIIEISADDAVTWKIPTATYPGTVKINPSRSGGYNCVSNPFHVDGKSGYVQTQATAITAEIEVPAASLTDKMRIRFSQASGVSSSTTNAETSRASTASGWRIDDVHFIVK